MSANFEKKKKIAVIFCFSLGVEIDARLTHSELQTAEADMR